MHAWRDTVEEWVEVQRLKQKEKVACEPYIRVEVLSFGVEAGGVGRTVNRSGEVSHKISLHCVRPQRVAAETANLHWQAQNAVLFSHFTHSQVNTAGRSLTPVECTTLRRRISLSSWI
jgi:hypothetical protein